MDLVVPFCTMFISTLFGLIIGKYLYIAESKSWTEAQVHCRTFYTDLALINSQTDQDLIILLTPATTEGWIGLYLVNRIREEWMWSGAGLTTYTNWDKDQPNYWGDKQDAVKMNGDGLWNDYAKTQMFPFYCCELIVKKDLSWERASEHCKTKGANLTELPWDNEVSLIKNQMQREGLSLVWTGLRFLGDRWMWVSGGPLEPEKHVISQCPVNERCGALNPQGALENRNCEEKLFFVCD
ncbi:unnamed protein product [Knipowitschia caucasica]